MRLTALPTANRVQSSSMSLLVSAVGIALLGCVITVLLWHLQKSEITNVMRDPNQISRFAEFTLVIQLVSGLFISVLIGTIFFMLAKSRRTALQMADKMTAELQVATDELAAKKRYLETILASLGEGVLVLDAEGKVELSNSAATQILNKSSKEILTLPYTNIFTVMTNKNEPDTFIERAITNKSVQEASISAYIHIPGSEDLPINSIATPLLDTNNNVSGAVVVFRDASRERELDKLKDDFVSIASHELRTPLTAIVGLVEMILDGEYGVVSEQLKQPLNDIDTSSDRLINLVNDLLNVSKIQSGKLTYVLASFPIDKIISNVTNLLQALAAKRGIQLIIEPVEEVLVQVDQNKLEQVLNNLMGNALKFTDKGTITVSVKEQEQYVHVSVKDTGMGISLGDQTKLFGKFQQLGSGNNRPQGTGLGLYISREMVRNMGGELWLEYSELGKGSEFICSLPRAGTPLAAKVATNLEKETAQKSQPKSA